MRQRTEIGILIFETDAKVNHSQKSTFKHNRQMAALNIANHIQGAKIDLKDERKAERQREREQKRKQYKY